MKKIGKWTVDDKGWGWFFIVVILVWYLVVLPFVIIPLAVGLWLYDRVIRRFGSEA